MFCFICNKNKIKNKKVAFLEGRFLKSFQKALIGWKSHFCFDQVNLLRIHFVYLHFDLAFF